MGSKAYILERLNCQEQSCNQKMLEFRANTSCYISAKKGEEKDMEGIVKEVGPKIPPEESLGLH